MSAQAGIGIKRMSDRADYRIKPGTEGAAKNSFSGRPDPNNSAEGSSMVAMNRRLRGMGRTNFLREPMLLIYSLVGGGMVLAAVIRIALDS